MIPEIQYLRAMAALMVLLYHLHPQLARMGWGGEEIIGLSGGVDVFFCISGFIMTHISLDRAPSPKSFLIDRFVRIVPVYWLLTMFMVVVGLAVPNALQSSVLNVPHVLASLAFVPWTHPVNGHLFPLFQPGWTLDYEIWFYLIFAAFLNLSGIARHLGAIVAIIATTLVISVIAPSGPLRFYGDDIVYEFCAGILFGLLYGGRREQLARLATPTIVWSLFATGLVAILVLHPLGLAKSRFLAFGLPGATIVASALLASIGGIWPRWSLAERIGDASYSLYLTHYVMLSFLGQIARRLLGTAASGLGLIGFAIVAPIVCVGVALFFFDRVERPLHRFLRRRLAERPVPA